MTCYSSCGAAAGLPGVSGGLLAPRDRNKTLTALAEAEPVAEAQHAAVQRLQFFLSESRWDPNRVNDRKLELLRADPATAPHDAGVLVVDDSGDRKDRTKTAHVGRQWLGGYGMTDNGVVTVTAVWAGERIYYPVHAVLYTRRGTSPRGRTTRRSASSWRSARAWRPGRGRRGSYSGSRRGLRLRGPGRVPHRAR